MGVNSANKGYIGTNSTNSYSGVDSTRTDYYDVPNFGITPYTRPSEWISLPTVTAGQQILVGTFAVYNHDSNFVAFTIQGNYNVNWGDGTTGAFSSNVAAYKRYDTTTYSGLTSSVFRGYKTLNITITPQSGATLTNIDLRTKHNQSSLSNYTNQWLDIRMSTPGFSGLTRQLFMDSSTIPMGMLEQFEWVNTTYQGSCQNLFANCYSLKKLVSFPTPSSGGADGMFSNCYSLQELPWFNTSSYTLTNGMFQNCRTLRTIPAFNFTNSTDVNLMFSGCSNLVYLPQIDIPKATNLNAMFSQCRSLTKVPLMNTASAANVSAMFLNCSSLKVIPPFDTRNVTNFASFVNGCLSLEEFPLINTSAGTNFSGMFNSCGKLRTIPALNTSNGTNFNQMFYSMASLETVPLLDTSKGTDFGEMFMFSSKIQNVPNFNLSSATTTAGMFRLCSSLLYLPDFNVSKSTNLNLMIGQCPSLLRAPNLTLGTAGITFATNAFENMFLNNFAMDQVPSYDLRGVSSGSGFANIYNAMFSGCNNISTIGITGFNHNINVSGCRLSGTALNELYTSLAVVGASGSATKTITVSNNWGAATDDPNIAIAKGWQVTG